MDIEIFSDFVAFHSFLKAVNVGSGTECQIGSLSLGASSLKLYAVHTAHIIQVDGVTGLYNRPLCGIQLFFRRR